VPLDERLYAPGSYGPVRSGHPHATGRQVRGLYSRDSISDRTPALSSPATNGRSCGRRIAEPWVLAPVPFAMSLV
jgi:hypothetical protein